MQPRSFKLNILALVLAVLLVMGVPPGAAVHGPREEDLVISFYANQESAYGALATGDIDLIMYDLTHAQANNAFTDPNLVTCKVPDSGFYEFDLNNNYTIPTYPGIRSPMNYTEMRQACAFLSDKDYYVNTLYDHQAMRIDQMIAAPYYGWANTSMSYPYYPYEYSPAGAKAVLDSRFPVGTTPNPWYDAWDPLSSPYLRHYPDDHPQKSGQDLDPLIFYVRMEVLTRLLSGRTVYQALRRMGVPIDATECPSSVSYGPVHLSYDYHFYTGGWSAGRFPPITLYGLYHSINAYPYGPNYVTGSRWPFVGDNATDPRLYRTHPKLDELLYKACYAASYSEAITYTKLAAGYMTEICVNVPLWSVAAYWAWSSKLLGVVNMQGNDPECGYTFMNAYKIDGTPIRCGTINYPTAVNIVYSNWIYDYNILDRINLYGGVDWPAYNIAADQAGFVDAWDTTTWDDGGELKTKVVMSFREDGYTAKPVSGDQGERINASHYFWNAWLDYQIGDGWYSSGFADLHHIDITSPYDFEIYFDTYSYWNTYFCQGPLRPMDLWMAQGPAFINQTTETVTAPTMPGAIPLTHNPIWLDSVTADGVPLTSMTDYNIIRGDLCILTPQTGDLDVTYYYIPPLALRGYYPGNLTWQTILEGAGQYYITSYTVGISATFKRNPFYYMVTPLLGDIDFVKKPSGNYKVDIFDLALAGGAYGSQGTGIPSSNWLPGADLAPEGGKVDILDLVTIAGVNWDREYDPIEP
jgi:ABC-type transport system substrate-binding protein